VETERLRAELALEVARLEGEAVVVAAEADARAIEAMMHVWSDLTVDIREIMLRQLSIEVWDGALPRVIVNSAEGENFSLILDLFGEH
jgi:hypothetical protein